MLDAKQAQEITNQATQAGILRDEKRRQEILDYVATNSERCAKARHELLSRIETAVRDQALKGWSSTTIDLYIDPDLADPENRSLWFDVSAKIVKECISELNSGGYLLSAQNSVVYKISW